MGRYSDIIAGMPGGRHSTREGELPKPPLAWSAMLASRTAWYSGVSGACCPRPGGLVGSNAGWSPTPTASHCPERSGYFASSNAQAATADVTAAANAVAASNGLRDIVCSLACFAVGAGMTQARLARILSGMPVGVTASATGGSRAASRRTALGARLLHRRARHVAERAEHAAIAWFRLHPHAASPAFVEKPARIRRHRFGGAMAAGRTGDRRQELHLISACDQPADTPAPSRRRRRGHIT